MSVKAGKMLEVQVVADDADGDNAKLKYHLADAPEDMQITGTGLIQWAVSEGAEDATINVEVSVFDDREGGTSRTLEVSVEANKAPSVEAIDPIVVKTGDKVEVAVSATDPEGEALSYKALALPEGFERTGQDGDGGKFVWDIKDTKEGSYTVEIEVADASGAKTVVAVQITLEKRVTITLLSASEVVGPYEPETEAVIDESDKSITVAKVGGMRFYKLQSGDDTKLKITSIVIKEDKVLMSYKPAGE